ncbi:tRNA-dihydrouridine(20a/20b) synthase [NAD(P)+]-like isoform X1 [Tribolium castaneum]|uniref:tRNA-dihydrouridine(20a/20b) synthase [NAD(P)+] n=2 Tax=Tribolium castaneum TaxID=7070 RepID=D6WQ25_TRICA|nr:PREDICTED: tRNA-dihydrouridine(20a/20b) synthase [NAD(P)+]-like [Tribolium castaneum]EFA06141.2 tRNA-dihydrouridine(20a/20b) synthase [NAD(P)+]-like [Tribolium castaneum]|eukprot:XP_974445.2 PREDICTED: tRNA-dihydrouridine(20a/20b) synthase [NAD(P)+]-like [Tribolium castaneum]
MDQESDKILKHSTDVMQLFADKKIVKICAPMVRYSKLQFRNLVKSYNCDLCYTPMILADSFCKSGKARANEFTTNMNDTPLITQFAANKVYDFVGAAYMVSPFCDGVDLNCGCPQRWAKLQGLGCIMLEKPEVIYDLVKQCRNVIPKPFTVSVKLRLQKDLRRSVEICRQLEHCGVSFLTVHGRTPDQLTGEVNKEALNLIVGSVNVPVVANGGVKSLEDCLELQEKTNCKGVMVANGLLTNPTLFTESSVTTTDCIQRWLNICYNTTLDYRDINRLHTIPEKPKNLTFQCFHHHLVFMLEKILTRSEKRIFNNLQTFEDVLSYIKNKFNLAPQLYDTDDFNNVKLLEVDYGKRGEYYFEHKPKDENVEYDLFYDHESHGKYFKSKVEDDCNWSDIFLENG